VKVNIFFVIGVCFLIGITNLKAQSTSKKNYFVVIGVYPRLDEAVKLMDEANQKGFNAQYARHEKGQYYVYLLQADEQKKAKTFLNQIHQETGYKKAWLFKGKLGNNPQ
jgi:hypothetical protein